MSNVASHLGKKILGEISSLETSLSNDVICRVAIEPEIEKLLEKIKHIDALNFYIRQNADPKQLRSLFGYIRALVDAGDLVAADKRLEQFKSNAKHIRGLLLRYGILSYRGHRGRPRGKRKSTTDEDLKQARDLLLEERDNKPTTVARAVLKKRGHNSDNPKGAVDHLARLLKR